MSRIPQKADQYADAVFERHLRTQRAYYGLDTQGNLANAVGISQATVSNHIRDFWKVQMGVFKKYIKALHIDPMEVLLWLGYSKKDISKSFKHHFTENTAE